MGRKLSFEDRLEKIYNKMKVGQSGEFGDKNYGMSGNRVSMIVFPKDVPIPEGDWYRKDKTNDLLNSIKTNLLVKSYIDGEYIAKIFDLMKKMGANEIKFDYHNGSGLVTINEIDMKLEAMINAELIKQDMDFGTKFPADELYQFKMLIKLSDYVVVRWGYESPICISGSYEGNEWEVLVAPIVD
jgi:hypothetical protein